MAARITSADIDARAAELGIPPAWAKSPPTRVVIWTNMLTETADPISRTLEASMIEAHQVHTAADRVALKAAGNPAADNVPTFDTYLKDV